MIPLSLPGEDEFTVDAEIIAALSIPDASDRARTLGKKKRKKSKPTVVYSVADDSLLGEPGDNSRDIPVAKVTAETAPAAPHGTTGTVKPYTHPKADVRIIYQDYRKPKPLKKVDLPTSAGPTGPPNNMRGRGGGGLIDLLNIALG